jgi:hypothetical protein
VWGGVGKILRFGMRGLRATHQISDRLGGRDVKFPPWSSVSDVNVQILLTCGRDLRQSEFCPERLRLW